MHLKVAPAEYLLFGCRAGPVAGVPHTAALVPDGDRNCVTTAWLTFIRHRHLECGVTIDADGHKRVSDILNVCLAIERGCRIWVRSRYNGINTQRRHGVTFDLIRPAIVPNDRINVSFRTVFVVLDIE